jgi:peptide deformylase
MTIRQVLKMGDPLLLNIAEPVHDFKSQTLKVLIEDMQDTMHALNGAGLAAPQIGVSLRVVIFGVEKTPRYPDAEEVPYTILINPKLTFLGDEMDEGWEGCLSVPGMRGLVPRFKKLRYQGYDLNHNPIDRTVSDFHARVVQHECDHLDGVLYPMRIEDLSNFGFSEVLFPDSDLQDD